MVCYRVIDALSKTPIYQNQVSEISIMRRDFLFVVFVFSVPCSFSIETRGKIPLKKKHNQTLVKRANSQKQV